MKDFWAKHIEQSGLPGQDYWDYFAGRLVQLANIPNNKTILDIGTFDGNVLLKAMPKMETSGYGIGVDIDFDGFEDGTNAVKNLQYQKSAAFIQTDASALGLKSAVFDTVLANFVGWDDCFDFERMEFRQAHTKILEIMRVLRPGGQVGIGGWVEQSDIDWLENRFRKYLPGYGTSSANYARENPEGQKIILQNAGFEAIRVRVETTDFILPDAEIWWRQMRQAASGIFRQITDPGTLDSFKEQVFKDLRQHHSQEGIRFSKTVTFAFGTKPV